MPAERRSPVISPQLRERVDRAMQRMRLVPGFGHVKFIILYGSAAENRMTRGSDIDLCVYYDGGYEEAARFRHAVLSELPENRYDIQIFQHLPLYVRVEVLKGIPVFCRTSRFLYDKAAEALRDFDGFKHRLYDYTGEAPIQ
ncbi:MAG: nucleotidyltransferase domain-containing protein [Methanoregula sp.]|nr:nucleotidyltransferase domain-containing protein [Methanoregula sp.]